MKDNLLDLKRFCRLLADESGRVIREYYRTALQVETKDDLSPVTIADRKTEEVLREFILRECPEHGILGEEFGVHNSGAEYQWVLDPIDGTKSFICGMPNFCTLIALLKNGEPVLGVINQPVVNEYMIGDGALTELNGARVTMPDRSRLEDMVLVTDDHFMTGRYQNGEFFEQLIRKVRLYRTWGNGYSYAQAAAGFVDIALDPIMAVWDKMALIPVIRGAGGLITNFQGGSPTSGESIVAANSRIHATVISILNNGEITK